ncbi:MAG: phosphoribosylamine--glycine ligase [Nitriliruptoraceae bacterium]
MGHRVLVIGGGGREHALAWRLATSPSVAEVHTAPGNPGTAEVGPNHSLDATDPIAVAGLAAELAVDLVVVGPEAPLVAGAVDELNRRQIPAFGPTAAAAHLEGSKAFAKDVMLAAGVATAGYTATDDRAIAHDALDRFSPPYVVKADGLAAGKGVRICTDLAEARSAVDDALVHRIFGDAGDRLVIEEFLEGPERSVFGVCDGTDAVLLTPAQDYKRVFDGDDGANTGGMGAYAPVPGFGRDEIVGLADLVFRPVLNELAGRGTPFRGLLYAGLVDTADGPKLLEFNVRFGDPETQVILPLLASDLGELLVAAATARVGDVNVSWHDDAAVTVVLASGGYPGTYDTGTVITGVDGAAAQPGTLVFHAGTARDDVDRLVTAGGRVLAVTGRGATIADARACAYAADDRIDFAGRHRRTDIAANIGR